MPFRVRRSIRLLPGLRLNIGKRGASVSLGGRGAHVTLGHGQVRETVGLPGSGLSFTHVSKPAADASGTAHDSNRAHVPVAPQAPKAGRGIVALLLILLGLTLVLRIAFEFAR